MHFTVEHFIKFYSKLRNFHNQPVWLFPSLIFANETAKFLNYLLKVLTHQNTKNQNLSGPTLPTTLFHPSDKTLTPFYHWQSYRNYSTKPVFLENFSYSFNLAYCDVSRYQYESPWNLSFLNSSFNKLIWLPLLSALMIVAFVLSKERGNECQDMYYLYAYHLFLAFSASLSPYTGLSIWKVKYHWSLFILWMRISAVILISYLGVISSQIIKPIHLDTLKNA